jgi:NADH-quinone oxidoreductase subunit E
METVLKKIFKQYEGKRNELIPILQKVQDKLGYLPKEALDKVAVFTRTPDSLVFGVATFYAQFYLTRQGRHRIKVCSGTACHVKGGRRILKWLEKELGIIAGETTEDKLFTLETVRCLGCCSIAPVMRIDNTTYGQLEQESVSRILKSYIKGKKS